MPLLLTLSLNLAVSKQSMTSFTNDARKCVAPDFLVEHASWGTHRLRKEHQLEPHDYIGCERNSQIPCRLTGTCGATENFFMVSGSRVAEQAHAMNIPNGRTARLVL